MNEIVKTDGLYKAYGKKSVLEGVSFSLAQGEIVGLLGPNGSGKTTLIKILTGLIKDHKGVVEIDGCAPGVHTKSVVAYLPDKSYLPDWMRPTDAIGYFADFYKDFDKEKAMAMMQRFGVDMNQRLKTMSKGQQEKVNLILVICRRAKVYKAVRIPIIGLGGISNWKDAVEFMLAGATAIQIGTYNFVDPTIGIKVIDGLNEYCDRHGFHSVKELTGALEV